MRTRNADKVFLLSTLLLVVAGFFIFSSASLGYLARQGISYSTVALKQFLVGFVAGGIVLIIAAKIEYRSWRRYAFYIFLLSILACIAVFIPHIGFAHGGARRWINIGSYTFQPAEILKLGAIIYFAAWISAVKSGIMSFKHGALPLFIIIGITGALVIKQPDTGTFMVIFAALVAMFIAAGGRWRYIALLIAVSALAIFILAKTRPYVMSRIETFLDPSRDSLGSGYQIQQSLIAIGSGGIIGRGYGQSVQKFGILPEPIGDSIFAVASEEFGFIGSTIIVLLFLFFTLRGFKIATKVKDTFGMSLCVGLVTLIATQSFVNIAAMLGVLPLTGIPLIFVSHGGTAMLFALAEVGIILNISKHERA
jgi:cell division protein FtsW